MASYTVAAADGTITVRNTDSVSALFHHFELRGNGTATAGTVKIQARRPGAEDSHLVDVGTYDFSSPSHIDHIGPVSDWVFTSDSITGVSLFYVTITSTETGKDEGGASGFIDDSTVSTDKTYSSNKIESRIEADGFPNDGYIILNESYKTLKKGATYIYGRDDDLSELPKLNSRQLNIINFGDIYNDRQNLFLLASPDDDDGIWCWCRVAGVLVGKWFRIGSYNDMLKLDAITNTGSGEIMTTAERTKLAGLSFYTDEDQLMEGLALGGLYAKDVQVG
ncbi:MAG: hypothetical protein AAGJ17_00120 [Pseudomonadota bacterium]